MLNVNNSDVYTDLNSLAKLKTAARDNAPEALQKVAKQFESVFLNMVLKSMRQAKLSDGLMDSEQSKFYQDMYDQQLSVNLAGNVGLADMIVQQLSPKKSSEISVSKDLQDYQQHPLLARQNALEPESILVDAQTGKVARSRFAAQHYPQANFGEVDDIQALDEHFEPSSVVQSKQQFLAQLLPMAEAAAQELGVEPKVLLAQAALETRWGQAVIKQRDGSSTYNLFNIKASKAWQGQQANVSTLEFEQGVPRKVISGFRAYNSYAESFRDYVAFIKTNPRYQEALQYVDDPKKYMQKLQQAGYATDPQYASKVMAIYHGQTFAGYTPEIAQAVQADRG